MRQALELALEALSKVGYVPDAVNPHPIFVAITAIKEALAQPEQETLAWKLMPKEPTEEMLKAMDECSTEGYDERLYAGHASSVYMAAWDAQQPQPERYITDAMKVRQAVAQALLDDVYAEELEQPEAKQSGTISITMPAPIAYLCENATGHKYFRWKKPASTYKPIPLYTTPPQPEQEPVAKLQVTLEDRPIDIELAQYKRMFEAACSELGAINEALGLDPNDGGAEPILFAIEQLRGEPQEPVAWMVYTLDGQSVCVTDNPTDFTPEHRALPLYTTPPQPEQRSVSEHLEPVAWIEHHKAGDNLVWDEPSKGTPLYTKEQPPQRKPLTDEQIEALWDNTLSEDVGITALRKITRAIEAAHGIKE